MWGMGFPDAILINMFTISVEPINTQNQYNYARDR